MSGCVSLGATAIMLTVIYLMVRAFTAPKKGGNGASGSGGVGGVGGAGSTQSWGTDPGSGRQITVQVKGDSQWQWATITVPMAKPMPPGLVVGVRPTPRIALAPGASDERAFYALADAMGKSPERVTEWAIPQNRAAMLDAYWKLQQGFQVRGTTISANVPVSGGQDPQIQRAVYILAELAQRLSAVEGPAQGYGAAHAEPEHKEDEDEEDEEDEDDEDDEDEDEEEGGEATVKRDEEDRRPTAGAPRPTDAPPVARVPSSSWNTPVVVAPLPSASPSPFAAAPGATAAASPFATSSTPGATAAASPFAATPGATAAASPFAAAPGATAAPSPFAASTPPYATAASLASTPAPSASAALSTSLPAASAGEAASASDLLSAVVKQPSSEAQERFVADTWAGRLVSGEGKVSFHSTVFGRDSELDVTGGIKVTVELPVQGAGLLAPKVVLHLSETPPQGALGFGKMIRFAGEVKGYRGLGRSLLLLNGRLL